MKQIKLLQYHSALIHTPQVLPRQKFLGKLWWQSSILQILHTPHTHFPEITRNYPVISEKMKDKKLCELPKQGNIYEEG